MYAKMFILFCLFLYMLVSAVPPRWPRRGPGGGRPGGERRGHDNNDDMCVYIYMYIHDLQRNNT